MAPGSGGRPRRARRPRAPRPDPRPWGTPHAAGVEMGRAASGACVPEDRAAEPGRSFGTLTQALEARADGLAAGRADLGPAERWAVRASGRHRAAPIQHRHQALHQLHVQGTQGRTALTGAAGRAMMRAMVASARDPVHLARGRAPRWARRTEDLAQAWTGHDHPAPGLALTPGRALDAVSTEPGRECAAATQPGAHASPPPPACPRC
jgi:hypothetical protein